MKQSRILSDILAGLTLAAVGIPEVMGYTKIIGTPVVTGLYTLVFPVLAFAWLGSSRYLVVAADSATAAIVAAALLPLGLSSPDYAQATGLIALLAGAMLLAARFLKLAFLSHFLSRTVLVGFLTGVGVQVAAKQIRGMFGVDGWGELVAPHLPSLLIAVATLTTILLVRTFYRAVPGALIAVVSMIAASFYLDFAAQGVRIVGELPSGLPQFHWYEISWDRLVGLVPVSLACCLVILSQSAATSMSYAFRNDEELDENGDLIGLAAANIAAALSGTFVVNGSPTKTEIVSDAGGHSQLAQVTTAGVVLLVLIFLTKPLAFLPEPVLAAIVFMIGLKLIDYRGLRQIYKNSKGEFWLAVLTAATVIAIGVEQGILLSLGLSLLYHVRRSYKPKSSVLTCDEERHWSAGAVSPRQVVPGFLVYWFGADLFYANVSHFVDETLKLVRAANPPLRWLVIDAGAITGMDYSAVVDIQKFEARLEAMQVKLVWAHVSERLATDMKRIDPAKQALTFETLRDALNTYLASSPQG